MIKTERVALDHLSAESLLEFEGESFFASAGYARLWRTAGGRPVYYLVEVDGQLAAAMPGLEFGPPGLRRFQAMPDGTYANLLYAPSCDANLSSLARAAVDGILEAHYARTVIVDHGRNLLDGILEGVVSQSTQLVDISADDWEPPDRKMRQQIRRASRKGFELVPFQSGRHMDPFLRLVELTSDRHGQSPRYDRKFLTGLADLAITDARLRWTWFEHDGQPVASNIFVVERDQLLHWQMFYDPQFSHLQATKFVPFAIARQAAADGIKYLNLGGTPPGADGAEEYKRKWGGVAYSYPCLDIRSGLGKLGR